MIKGYFLIILLCTCLGLNLAQAQSCPINSLGQNPSTAFPVCGTGVFMQELVNLCGGTQVPNPKCKTNPLTDINPYWYKFTCFEGGSLGFTIEPKDDVSDYDWQLFDITGHDPNDVYSNESLTICSNWSQYFGSTGTTKTATNIFECEGEVPKYSKMPTLVKGHSYLLLVSNFSNMQNGYKLTFSGGTASITDTIKPALKSIEGACDAMRFGIKLNKRMKCSSLAANGSDFELLPALANVTKATAASCSSGFDMDSIILTLDKPLPPGLYSFKVKKGSDSNTILDNCDNSIFVGDSLTIQVKEPQPSPMDSIMPVGCKPTTLHLVFNRSVLCSSIAGDGSDFTISGPSAVSVTGASAACTDGGSRIVNIQLNGPIQTAGIYTLTLKRGSDGNTLMNDCLKETPAGSINLRAYDTVSAAINYRITSSCVDDTIHLSNAGRISINSWRWTVEGGTDNTQNIRRIYSSGTKSFTLAVSNGVCTDSATISVSFDKNRLKAAFAAPGYVCPLDSAVFADLSTGPITSWHWSFGNGASSIEQQPNYQFYPIATTLQEFTNTLTIFDVNGCSSMASHTILVPNNCYIAVPTAFTPNGDGLNDYLYPLNAYQAINLDFKVYNRYGQLIWQTTDWTKKWDGRINGNLQAAGSYVWHLVYFDSEKNRKIDLKGTTTLIR